MSFCKVGNRCPPQTSCQDNNCWGNFFFLLCQKDNGEKWKTVHFGNRYQHHQATESLQGVLLDFLKVKKGSVWKKPVETCPRECQLHFLSGSQPSTSLIPHLHAEFYVSIQQSIIVYKEEFCSALQIQVLPSYKTVDNDFTFWSTFAHTTKPFQPEALQSTLLCSRNKISLNRRETLRF